MEIERKLEEMGYELPPTEDRFAGHFVRTVQTGNLVYLAGHGAWVPEGGFLHMGKLGSDLTIEQGYECARLTALNMLASLKEHLGDLDRVKQVVKMLCMINCDPDFKDAPLVANGASDLLVNLYGGAGRHARSAVGMSSLPFSIPIEIEIIVEVAD